MPSAVDAAAFQALLARLATIAASAVDTTNYPDVVVPAAAAAGTLTAQWYHDLNPGSDFAVEAAPPPTVEQLAANVGWALTQADPAAALQGSAQRHVFGTSRDTVVANASREGVKVARYASANACPWCRVLATRGAVYSSEQTASKGHDNDHCVAVPVREGVWEPPDYVQQWQQDYNQARDAAGGDINTIVNYMRTQT